MNNRQYYKAKEKGPEGPLGFPINLPKRGIQANAKGSKRPRGFLVSHQEGGIKTNAKRGQRATWVFSKPPKRGIKTNAKRGQRTTWVFSKPPAKGDQYLMPNLSWIAWKTCPTRKVEFYYFKGKTCWAPGSNWYKNSKEVRAINPWSLKPKRSAVTYSQFLQYPDWNRTSQEIRAINPWSLKPKRFADTYFQ